jgi:tetratricopeptide (TPR) repeat protein
LEAALDVFQKAVIMNPEYAVAYANVAITLIGMERAEEAIFFCEKSMELDPYLPDASAYMAIIQHELGKLDRSISLNLRAASLARSKRNISRYSIMDRGSVYYNLACAYALKKKPDQALSNLEKAFHFNSTLRENAATDTDLKILFDNQRFKNLLLSP